MPKQRRKWWLYILVPLVILLVILVVTIVVRIRKQEKQLQEMDKTPINLSEVKDGEYEGESVTAFVQAKVKVLVESGKLKKVEILKHQHGKGEAAEAIVDDMVRDNTIEVDSISGATVSSEVIKDAVRNALR